MIKRLLAAGLGSVLLSSLLACGGEGRDPSDTGEQLTALMEETVSPEYEQSGILLGVWAPGKGEWVLSRGKADLDAARAVDRGDYWRIASITKTFTGTIVLQLAEEGTLRLDDTIDRYCRPAAPGSKIPPIPDGERITVRMLLSHTTGIRDYGAISWIGTAFLENPFRIWRPEEIVQASIDSGPSFVPGARFEYSNTNTYILGMLVEQLTEHTFQAEIQARIFDRIGLTKTSFPTIPEMPIPFIHEYSIRDGRLADVSFFDPSFSWAPGAVISTLDEMKRYAAALTDGSLLGADMQAERMQWWEEKSAGWFGLHYPSSKYGLHIMSYAGFVGHSGSSIGLSTMVVRNPTNGATIVFVSNQPSFDSDLFLKKVIRIVFPEINDVKGD